MKFNVHGALKHITDKKNFCFQNAFAVADKQYSYNFETYYSLYMLCYLLCVFCRILFNLSLTNKSVMF